jgi:hypothetical protein
VPNSGLIDRDQTRAVVKRIRLRAKQLKSPFDWVEFKQDRDAGRP